MALWDSMTSAEAGRFLDAFEIELEEEEFISNVAAVPSITAVIVVSSSLSSSELLDSLSGNAPRSTLLRIRSFVLFSSTQIQSSMHFLSFSK
jgi:hypothetical protein